MKKFSINSQHGFSIIEVLLAATIFVIFATAAMVAVVGGFTANRLGQENSIATQFASEGLEAVRSIRNQGFSNIDGLASGYCSSGTGVQITGGVWTLKASGTSDTLTSDSRFSRIIKICDSQRTATSSSNLATSGTTYQNVKKVTSTVSWTYATGHSSSVTLITYLSNWRSKKGGMLLFGDGGTTSNTIKYQVYNAGTDTWGGATATQVSLGSTSSYALRAVRIYSSPTRNEKIAIARMYNGTTQEIWVMVYNGNTATWGNATKLTNWNATTFLDVKNFDGTYLNNGDFMTVYSDNSSTPKFATWNGSSWNNTGVSMQAIAGTPIYIVVSVRPGTSEVMASFTDSANNTTSEYFNGGTYVVGNWGIKTIHATALSTNTEALVDFNWIPNTLTGAVIYSISSSNPNVKVIATKIFTANGAGGGTWAASGTNSPSLGVAVGAVGMDVRNYVNEFIACDKTSTPNIQCFKSTNAPAWSTPTNNTIAAATDAGIERSFDIAYQATSGAQAVIVYSDNTATPKYKKYNPVTTAFDSAATSLTAMAGTVTGVKAVPQATGDDVLFLMFDNTQKVSSIVWNRNANAMYSAGGKAQTTHPGASTGSASNEFWADFAWDNY